jgi:hypothetical protein
MALPENDERLFNLLANDPAARNAMLSHAKRLNPSLSIPEIDAAAAVEEKINSALKPWQERVDELQKKLDEKFNKDTLESRRAEVKGAPFFFNDEQIHELEERMMKDRNMYGNYAEAARYYQYQDMPNHPTGAPLSPFSRRTPGSEDWRSMVRDPKNPIFDKRKRKDILSKKWDEGGGSASLIKAMNRGK